MRAHCIIAILGWRWTRSNWRSHHLLGVQDVDSRVAVLTAYLAHILSVLSLISFTQTFTDSTVASDSSLTLPPALW